MSIGTGNASLVSSIESEISKVKENLKGVDESLKRLTGRDFAERRPERRIHNIKRDVHNTWDEEPIAKKKEPTGIFARLGAPILDGNTRDNRENRHRTIEFSGKKEELSRKKPTLSSSVARPVNDGKSRSEAAAALTNDRASRDRNRRMFGALLGTLQRFQNDEAKQKDKDEQRAAIDKKLEEKGKAEKEQLRQERLDLFNQRVEQQAKIKFLQYKMNRVKEHDAWETHQLKLRKFIRTDCKPSLYWLPKISTEKSSLLIKSTKMAIDRELEDKKNLFNKELEDGSNARKDTTQKEDEGPQRKKLKSGDDNMDDTLEDLQENCDDILDFEVEVPRQVEEVNSSGKDSNPERVVVQVGSGMNGVGSLSQRRVELVPASRNGAKEHERQVQVDSESREIKVIKREKVQVKVSESNTDERVEPNTTAGVTENESVKSEREEREATEEVPADDVIKEKSFKKERIPSGGDENANITCAVEKQDSSDVPKATSVNVETAATSTTQVDVDLPAEMSDGERGSGSNSSSNKSDSSSSSSDESDDSSSTSESDSSESYSSESTSSSSSNSESESLREQSKKSFIAARKIKEERRKRRSSSNSSDNNRRAKPRRKRVRDSDQSSPARRDKRIDQNSSSKSKRKRSPSNGGHRGRSSERKSKK